MCGTQVDCLIKCQFYLVKAGNNVINEDNLMFSQQWQTIILFCHLKFFNAKKKKSDFMYFFTQRDTIPEIFM